MCVKLNNNILSDGKALYIKLLQVCLWFSALRGSHIGKTGYRIYGPVFLFYSGYSFRAYLFTHIYSCCFSGFCVFVLLQFIFCE